MEAAQWVPLRKSFSKYDAISVLHILISISIHPGVGTQVEKQGTCLSPPAGSPAH